MGSLLTNFGGSDPNNGKYTPKEQGDLYYWLTRVTEKGNQPSDVAFEFTQVDGDCVASGKSRSKNFSFSDNYSNYCNSWMPLKYTDTFINLKASECSSLPSNPDYTCVAY